MPFIPDDEWQALLAENADLKKQIAKFDSLGKQIAEQSQQIAALEKRLSVYENAHTPPSMQDIHLSKIGGNKQRGKPGREQGHEGVGRKAPDEIQQHKFLKLKRCPHCDSRVKNKNKRKRVITDIQPGSIVNTEFEIQRSFCPNCKKMVEPIIVDALSNSRFGLTLALYIAFLSMLGTTLNKIRTILLHDYNLTISKGTIANTLEQLAVFLGSDYEKLRLQVLEQKDVFADETSHPVFGKKHWLWTFIGKTVAYLQVDKSRGQKVVEKTLKGYNGILHSDFWSAYNKLSCDKQKCLAHLKRELKFLKQRKKSKELKKYCSKLERLLDYALKENRHSRDFRVFCEQRLHTIIDKEYADNDCQRLNKRLRRHANEIFIFAEKETETTNNNAERSLRSCVIKRKNTYGSYSSEGAQAHAVLASFYQTSQLQKQNFEKYVGTLIENQLQNRTQI